ncbi:MAG: carboxypeptidase-like regulatory domain-containing protein [Bacteroidetes bacterium]|nr:carboxypeptidase-like regulatory domain-containing protein [Bacteroidota bacterium]
MKIIFAFIITILLTHGCVIAQTSGIRGSTLSDKGEALPYAGIFIKTINASTSSNLDGRFEIKLAPGEYELIIQCLGYQTERKTIIVLNQWVDINILLNSTVYTLGEVQIKLNNEDPAYAIMRKAISMAKFYKYQIQEYSANSYIKGAARLSQIPWLMRKLMSDSDKKEIDTNKIFLIENISELNFKQPNIYKQKVIAGTSNMPFQIPIPIQFINGSFYEPMINGSVSPLSPRAFAYYSFKLEGSFYDGNYQINKIRVTPRSKGDNVFEGTIYIVDNLWCIQSLQLVTMQEGITTIVTQNYTEVQDKIWMPLIQIYTVYGTIYGFGFDLKYQASINNYRIKLNTTLQLPSEIIDEKTEKEKIKETTIIKSNNEKDIETLLKSEKKFTRKDMAKIMKLYEKSETKKEKEPEVVSNSTIEVDSMAYKKDSCYWIQQRTIPLTEKEVKSYERKDSLIKSISTQKHKMDSTVQSSTKMLLNSIQYKIDSTSKINWVYLNGSFNTVEGSVFKSHLVYTKKIKNKNILTIDPSIRYSMARNYFTGKGMASYIYGKDKTSGSIFLEGGKDINQFNANNPIGEGLNTIVAYWWGYNFMKIYEKEYYRFGLAQKISDQLYFKVNGEVSNRFMLSNSPTASPAFRSRRKYITPNSPINSEVSSTDFTTNKAFITQLSLKYYLGKKYDIRNGIKHEIQGSSPEITINYKKGWKDILNSNVDFDLIELGASYKYNIGIRGILNTKINFGDFINRNKMFFMDFQHFMGNRTILQPFDNKFRLLDYYKYSTSKYFAEGSVDFQPRKLLITQFILPRMAGLKEDLLFNYLYTPSSNNYIELSYGVDKIFRLFKFEIVTSYNNFHYQSMGFRIGLSTSLTSIFNQ